jgi:hypothetical protein
MEDGGSLGLELKEILVPSLEEVLRIEVNLQNRRVN